MREELTLDRDCLAPLGVKYSPTQEPLWMDLRNAYRQGAEKLLTDEGKTDFAAQIRRL